MFSVCTVTYGDYPELTKKCLDGIQSSFSSHIRDVRIGLNEVSSATFDYVMDWAATFGRCPVFVYQETSNGNVGKYPLMRRMFQEFPEIKDEDCVMWLDDDTHLNQVQSSWWDEVHELAYRHTVVGLMQYMQARGNQWEGIPEQPWFGNHLVSKRQKFKFATGAWWTAQYSFLKKWDYPFLEIYHNGGDSILGELCRQQNASIYDYRKGAHCNANCCRTTPNKEGVVQLNVGGREGRRGIGKKLADEVFPWHYHGENPEDFSHHNFDLKVYEFNVT